MKKGEQAGMPVPLNCTWYRVSPDPLKSQEFIPIDGVSGCCYQPTLDDIGFKICVHAIPASDAEEYQGMPMFSESKPLELDPEVTIEAEKLFNDFEDSVDRAISNV
jgi:hypothetical protein